MSESETIFEDEASVAEFKSLMSDPASRAAFVELKARAAENGARLKYQHVLRAVSETPWAMRKPMLGLIVDLLAFRVAGGHLTSEEIDARIGARRQTTAGPQGVAVLPLHGVIMPKASMMSEMSGGTSIDTFRQQFRQAMAAPDIAAMVIDVDSPGGMVDGVPEMAAEMRASRGKKPVVAVANTEAASAAYWLASQADEVVVSKSGRVGSIGVYTSHEDESQKSDKEGVRTTLISAGKFKTEGNPFEPLTEEARANLQSMVDDYYGMFLSDVAKGRRVPLDAVRSGYGEGRVVQARPALSAGMVDKVATLDEVIADMLGRVSQQRSAAASLGATTYTSLEGVNTTNTALTTPLPLTEDELAFFSEDGEVEFVAEPSMLAAVDGSAWDGNRAMSECNSASDYSSICAGEHTTGTPDQRQHWALPHHYLGKGPNAQGVSTALGRIGQTQNITDAERAKAQAHLDAHEKQTRPSNAAAQTFDPDAALLEALWAAKDGA